MFRKKRVSFFGNRNRDKNLFSCHYYPHPIFPSFRFLTTHTEYLWCFRHNLKERQLELDVIFQYVNSLVFFVSLQLVEWACLYSKDRCSLFKTHIRFSFNVPMSILHLPGQLCLNLSTFMPAMSVLYLQSAKRKVFTINLRQILWKGVIFTFALFTSNIF